MTGTRPSEAEAPFGVSLRETLSRFRHARRQAAAHSSIAYYVQMRDKWARSEATAGFPFQAGAHGPR